MVGFIRWNLLVGWSWGCLSRGGGKEIKLSKIHESHHSRGHKTQGATYKTIS